MNNIECMFSRAAAMPPDELTRAVLQNTDFRRVLRTDCHVPRAATQLVAMCVHDDTGAEVHEDTAQYFLVKDGHGRAEFASSAGRASYSVAIGPGSAWLVPPGVQHNVIANSAQPPLKLLTIYFPPHHPPDRVDKTHADAQEREAQKRAAAAVARV